MPVVTLMMSTEPFATQMPNSCERFEFKFAAFASVLREWPDLPPRARALRVITLLRTPGNPEWTTGLPRFVSGKRLVRASSPGFRTSTYVCRHRVLTPKGCLWYCGEDE